MNLNDIQGIKPFKDTIPEECPVHPAATNHLANEYYLPLQLSMQALSPGMRCRSARNDVSGNYGGLSGSIY